MASPGRIAAHNAARAAKVAELAEEARKATPADLLSAKWGEIAESAEPRGVAASDPAPVPVTFRDAVSRWYENVPGGFDGAVANSQRALAEHGVVYPHSNSPAYGNWKPEDVDRPVPVRVNWGLGLLDPRGTYSGAAREVRLNPALLDSAPKGRNPTIEHEMTHAMLDMGRPTEPQAIVSHAWRNASERFDGTPQGSATLAMNPQLASQYGGAGPDAVLAEQKLRPLVENEKYVMQRAELDPRIGEVRRRYAFYTGRDVVTPEDAAHAWDWYKANRGWLEDFGPHETPSMQHGHFDVYDALPDSSKQIMFRRMTQVPAVLAPVAAAAAAQQEQPGLLGGLNRR